MSFVRGALVALALSSITFASAAEPTPPTKEQILKAIEELSSDNFQARQRASAFLRNAGEAAEPFLIEAQKGAGLEVSNRLAAILHDFKWGVYPDTPKEVVEQINRYRGGEVTTKRDAINNLLRRGSPGFAALIKITSAENVAELRADLFRIIAQETPTAVPVLLVADNQRVVHDVLELSLTSKTDAAARNYAAYFLLRGRIDEKIEQFKKKVDKEGADSALVLAHLYRAKGDLAAARTVAAPFLLASQFEEEQGDWAALAKRIKPVKHMPDSLATCAAFQRLAGDSAAAQETLTALLDLGSADTMDITRARVAAKGLFLNDRPADAVALLIQKRQYLPAVDVLAAQSKYQAALDLLAKVAKDDDTPLQLLELRQAQLLHQLGDRDQSAKIIAKVFEDLQADGTFSGFRELIRTEQRLGLTDQAYEHAALALAKGWDEERAADLLKQFFQDHCDAAEVWWTFLREKYPQQKPQETMRLVRDIFEKRAAPKNFEDLVLQIDKSTIDDDDRSRRRVVTALAGAAMLLGKDDLELKYLKTLAKLAEKPAAHVRWGDLLVRKKEYKEAAQQYRLAWDLDPMLPLPLFLQGWALAQAGDAKAGQRLMDIAQVIPLASDELRYGLARGLAERGHADMARRNRELLLRLGPPSSWESNEAVRQFGYEAMKRGDHARAADHFERYRLRCLPADTTFIDYGAYVHVPALVHLNRAHALLAAGKPDEARKAADLALTLTPGNINIPIQLVAAFDKAERQADADALFGQVFALYARLTDDYPKSGMLHNSAAWLCAACRRDLDKGLAHAEKAAALDEKHTGYRDTLAEVHFQRGDKDKAIELMKRCLELDPASSYFKKQLQRFEAGDPKAPVPES